MPRRLALTLALAGQDGNANQDALAACRSTAASASTTYLPGSGTRDQSVSEAR